MSEIEVNYLLKCKELVELIENDQQKVDDDKNVKTENFKVKLESIDDQLGQMHLCLNAEKPLSIQQTKKDPVDRKEQNSVQLYVSGLKPEITETILHDYFERWGVISDIFIPTENVHKKHRGFGYVTFSDLTDKHPCDESPHIVNGCSLYVDRNEFSSTSEEKSSVLMINGAIQNIPTETIHVYFSKYGHVIDIIRKMNQKTSSFLRFAFLQFNSTLAVDNATKLNHQLIDGVLIHVRKAKNFEHHRSTAANANIEVTPVSPAIPSGLIFDESMLFKYRVLPLDKSITLDILKRYFNQYGRVVDSYIPEEYGTTEKKMYGYLIMYISKDSPVLNFESHLINGKKVRVELDEPGKNADKSKCIIVSASPKIIAKISEAQLKSFFKKFGKIVEVRKPLEPRSKTTTHYAFVEFHSEEAVEEVIKKSVYVINNLPFGVAKARKNPRRP